MEFTWDRSDEGDHVSGRGWLDPSGGLSLRGRIHLLPGRQLRFTAMRSPSSLPSDELVLDSARSVLYLCPIHSARTTAAAGPRNSLALAATA